MASLCHMLCLCLRSRYHYILIYVIVICIKSSNSSASSSSESHTANVSASVSSTSKSWEGFRSLTSKSQRLGGNCSPVNQSMTYILLRNTHPFWSGCRVEGSWRQACFHTHVTKFVRLILFDNTSEQGGSDVGLIPFISCKGFEVGYFGAYVRSNIS